MNADPGFPYASKSLQPEMAELVRQLARLWAVEPTRPRPTSVVIEHWDRLVDAWLNERSMNALTFSTECAAYAAEEACLRQREKKSECKSAEGKKRWDEQMKMVTCYKERLCKK